MQLSELPKLKDLGKDIPKNLYGLGRFDESIFEKVAAVVGSRRMTQYGNRVIEILIPRLVDEGYTVVSGFMYGVDMAVHEEVVKCGGKTVAVLGWGIEQHKSEYLNPKSQINYNISNSKSKNLSQRILDLGGMIISEWEDQMGALWTFPRRNRIVAALSERVYVIEAGVKSGSLITVELAIKLGREIWAVPGPVTSKVSGGTNQLIAEGRAKVWLPQLQFPNPKSQDTNKFKITNSKILGCLENEAFGVDELVLMTGMSAADVGCELTIYQLQGIVEVKEGKYYIVN